MSKSKKKDRFILWMTDELQYSTRKITPCAQKLWIWLYAQSKPNTMIEINLKDFAEKYDYGLPWIKKCYQELIDHGLWQENYRWYGGREYRGMVIPPTDPHS